MLPGGSVGAAHLHVARTVVRRAERTAWQAVERFGLQPPGGLNPLAITYLNRLSDLLFILARAANAATAVVGDVLWVPGGDRTPTRPTTHRRRSSMTDAVQLPRAPAQRSRSRLDR